ncbi:hypothetical protein Tco_0919815 [Tanacetum coccineum]
MPSFPSPEPKVSCFDDLDFFKDFENEFPAIVYNDALTSKLDFLTEPTLKPQHIYEFDLKNETSLFEYDEVEQNVLYFNDLFPFNIIYLDNLKSDKDNDDNEIDIIQSSRGNVHTQGSNKLLEASHDKINKAFIMEDFIMELNVNIVAWNYLVNGMLFNLIKNLYVSFGIPFDPKEYYKDGVYTRMLWRPRSPYGISIYEYAISSLRTECMALPPRDQRHQYLRGLTELMDEGLRGRMLMEHKDAQRHSVFTSRAWRRLFEIRGPLVHELILEFFSTFIFGEGVLDLDTIRDIQFQLGGDRQQISWRQFILALGLHTAEEMETTRFGLYWVESVPALMQAPQPPPLAAGPAWTMAKRLTRVEDDVHEIRGALGEQREILDTLARDFSRFST